MKHTDQVEAKQVEAGTATETQVLIGEQDGAPHFALRRFTMGADGGMPLHINRVEHEQFVVRGTARVVIGDREHRVTAGSVLFIPAGVAHSYNVIDAPFEFLCIVPNGDDEIRIC